MTYLNLHTHYLCFILINTSYIRINNQVIYQYIFVVRDETSSRSLWHADRIEAEYEFICVPDRKRASTFDNRCFLGKLKDNLSPNLTYTLISFALF